MVIKEEKRDWEYVLWPRMVYYTCSCQDDCHVNIDYHMTYPDRECCGWNCPNIKKNYLSYSIQFNKWLDERKRGQLIRVYKDGKFKHVYRKVNPLFKLLNIIRLMQN